MDSCAALLRADRLPGRYTRPIRPWIGSDAEEMDPPMKVGRGRAGAELPSCRQGCRQQIMLWARIRSLLLDCPSPP